MKNTIKIYGCGGAGINIVSSYIENAIAAKHMTDAEMVLIDTSLANIKQDYMERFHRIEDAKHGSGGLRGENLDAIRRDIKDTLLKHSPKEFNVVVFSAAGGSGSTIGPVLVSELLRQEKGVVVVTIIDNTNGLRTRNSYNTIRTLNNISTSTGAPVVIYPIINNERTKANTIAHQALSSISMLFSNQHRELDNADLYNFLRFDRVTEFKPQPVSLEIVSMLDGEDGKDVYSLRPIAYAALHSSEKAADSVNGDFVTSYSCDGFFDEEIAETQKSGSIFYLLNHQEIGRITEMLNDTMSSFNSNIDAEIAQSAMKVKSTEFRNTTEDGDFVL